MRHIHRSKTPVEENEDAPRETENGIFGIPIIISDPIGHPFSDMRTLYDIYRI